MFMEILRSASKIVFILIAITVCISFVMGRLSETNFMLLGGSAFTFYFAVKPKDANGDITK
jgi:hypothetical protein